MAHLSAVLVDGGKTYPGEAGDTVSMTSQAQAEPREHGHDAICASHDNNHGLRPIRDCVARSPAPYVTLLTRSSPLPAPRSGLWRPRHADGGLSVAGPCRFRIGAHLTGTCTRTASIAAPISAIIQSSRRSRSGDGWPSTLLRAACGRCVASASGGT